MKWVDHPAYGGYLQVSDEGGVRSLDRLSPKGRRLKGKLLAQSESPDGHLRVSLTVGSVTKHRYVHVLMLETFVGPRPAPDFVSRHLNGDPKDNRLTNLAWGSARMNRLDDVRLGVAAGMSKTECVNGHPLIPINNSKRNYAPGNGSGQRTCRACGNARSFARRTNTAFDVDVADAYFERIISNDV